MSIKLFKFFTGVAEVISLVLIFNIIQEKNIYQELLISLLLFSFLVTATVRILNKSKTTDNNIKDSKCVEQQKIRKELIIMIIGILVNTIIYIYACVVLDTLILSLWIISTQISMAILALFYYFNIKRCKLHCI